MTTAVAVAVAAKAPLVHLLPLGDIRQSPSNPRKTFADLDTLAEDLRLRGVLQPVLVRPVGESYELVFGERRWRAAKLAKLETIPAFVRELGDQEALELQIVENAKRADIHPVEEAEAYRELHEKHKLSVDEIAAKVGKSKAHVYGRIKLCELAEPVKKAALAGELPATHALLIARIPSAKLQAEALNAMRWNNGETMPYRQAVDTVHRHYMLELGEAQFDKTDEKLLPAAGSCTKCPKRTGNQPELFADVKAKDVCTDTVCFESKTKAFAQVTIEKAKAAGKKTLSAEESKKVLQYGSLPQNSSYVDLDEKDWSDPKHRTWREKLGKKAPPPVVAVDSRNKVHELVPRTEVQKVLPKKEALPARQASEETQQKKKLELRRKVVRVALPHLFAAAKKRGGDVLRHLVLQDLNDAEADSVAALAGAFELGDVGVDAAEKAIKARIAKASDAELHAIALVLRAGSDAEGFMWGSGYGQEFADACKLLRVDLKKLEDAEKRGGETPTPPAKKKPKAKK